MVPLGQGPLDFDGALRRFQRAPKLDQESVPDGLYLGTVKPRKNFPQQAAMLFQQLERELVVALGQRAVAHHIGKHDGSEFALLDTFGPHQWIKSDPAGNETANPWAPEFSVAG